jgi:radical SAM superfamily enzyme YgiQ (UPF0313 family)
VGTLGLRRALLINPWIYDFAAFNFWLKPLGLLYLASILRENGFQVALLDLLDRGSPGHPQARDGRYGTGNFHSSRVGKPTVLKEVNRYYKRYGVPIDYFTQRLGEIECPDMVFVTCTMTFWYPGLFEVVRIVKSRFPHVPVIVGGIYATLCHEHAKRFSGADFVIRGSAENGLDFLNISRYDGLDELPYPAYDLYPQLDYACILTSRGCPFRCTYCASSIVSGPFYQRNPSKVADEMEYYYWQLGVRDIVFYDDALLWRPREHIEQILDEIIRRKIKTRFHVPNGLHPRFLEERVAHKMKSANFTSLYLSLETSDRKRQLSTGGKVANNDLISALDNLEKAGYSRKEVIVYVLAGMADQSSKEVAETCLFVNSLGAKVHVVEYSVIPGTADWKKMRAEGRIGSTDPLFHNNSIFPLWRERRAEMQSLKDFAKVLNYAARLNLRLQEIH